MKTYKDIHERFVTAHTRVKNAMGEKYQTDIIDKFPLSLTDDAVKEVAIQCGWDDSFLVLPETVRAKAKAKARAAQNVAASSHNIGQMLSGHLAPGPVAPVAGPGPVVPMTGPVVAAAPVAPVAVAPSPVAAPVAPVAPMAPVAPVAPVHPVPPVTGPVVSSSAAPAPVAPVAPSAVDPVAPSAVVPASTGPAPVAAASAFSPVVDPDWVCGICQANDQGQTEALQCGHWFHSECLATWRGVSHIPVTHCPFRCHLTRQNESEAAALVGESDFDII